MVDKSSYLTIKPTDLIKGEISIELSFLEGVPLTLTGTGLIGKSRSNLL